MKKNTQKVENKKEIKSSTAKKGKIRIKKKTISLLIIFIAIPVLIFSGYEIVTYFIDSAKTKNQLQEYESQANLTPDENEAEVIPSDDAEDSPYWNYINMDLMDVDFTELKEKNSDLAGWLTVGGTNINYPFVQAADNDYYLTHSFDKSTNRAGWLFMDYRNDKNEYGKNTIIYAHNMKDKTMFGSLKTLLNKSWYNNEDNRVIKMSSEKYNTLWQIFSVYTIVTTNDYIWTDENFSSEAQYQEFLDKIKGRSYTDFKTSVNSKDRILTLSTCHGSDKKLVVHAKLIKIAAR